MDLDDFTAQGIHLGLEPPIDGEDDTDDQISTAMVQTMVAVAAMRGPGVLDAVKARVRDL